MRRSQGSPRAASRAPSPTPTAYSGISNYRTDSYRPIRDQKSAPAVPTLDYRQVSRTHFNELSSYLAAYLAKAAPNSRSTARQKLTRLTIQQFHELSTDVYDELVRRQSEKEVPFLPVREEFHPKRNQARQKLATLPTSRFEDLSSDVYFELARRYPEFTDSSNNDDASYDNEKSAPPQVPQRAISRNGGGGGTRSSDERERPSDSGYASSGRDRRRPSEDIYRRSEDTLRDPVPQQQQQQQPQPQRRPSEDAYGGSVQRRPSANAYANSMNRGSEYSSNGGGSSGRRPSDADTAMGGPPSSRRKPSRDIANDASSSSASLRQSQSRRLNNSSIDTTSTATGGNGGTSTMTASSGMIIPTKSTITEEDIQVPYATHNENRDSRDDDDDNSRRMERESRDLYDDPPETASDYASTSPALTGLNALSARLMDENGGGGEGERTITSGFRFGGGGEGGDSDDREKEVDEMRMRIGGLEREVEEREREADERVRAMEEELAEFRKRAEEQSAAMLALQRELDEVRARDAEKERRKEDEVRALRERCASLEDEVQMGGGGGSGNIDPEALAQLHAEMESVLADLDDLSRQNDALLQEKDTDLATIRDLDEQLAEYKRKYEQAKTELRSVKATSQLFTPTPKLDHSTNDQLPVSPNGGLVDIHVTAFLTAIDSLLSAGRSNAPSRVLTPMKAVVNAVSAIVDDARGYLDSNHPTSPSSSLSDESDRMETVHALCERAEATLSNLVTASRTHATSSGMAPVSLLDAAASHVSASVTELGRYVGIRKASRAEVEAFASSANSGTTGGMGGGFSPALRGVSEEPMRSGSGRRPSRNGSGTGGSPVAQRRRATPSEYSGSSSPPPPSNGGGGGSSEDAWAELKPYLEAQTEDIVLAIQHVLSELRTPTPAPSLNEHLTKVITIVSSIVAVCDDNLPAASVAEGKALLVELGDNANRLSEVQTASSAGGVDGGVVGKEDRQVMAKSGFAVAKAMKRLMTL